MEPTRAPWAASTAATPPSPMPPKNLAVRDQPSRDAAAMIRADPKMPALPVDPPSHDFVPAVRRIQSAGDLKRVLETESMKEFWGFILSLNEAVKGKKKSEEREVSGAVERLLNALEILWDWVGEIPPVTQSLRYGNPAYRTWFEKMAGKAESLVGEVLSDGLGLAVAEVTPYFIDSFGNKTRIDYGTGHELNFCAFLFALAKLGVVEEGDRQNLVFKVFDRYLELMRKIQTTYWLEPAGSHGVWGLDDYQFLPFIWGSAQLIDHPTIKPKSIHNEAILADMAKDYMYLECVEFVKRVKKGPLWETSPYLCDIAGVPAWTKVNSGLLKMYQAEVLGKFPIMQHFLFGSLIDYPEQ